MPIVFPKGRSGSGALDTGLRPQGGALSPPVAGGPDGTDKGEDSAGRIVPVMALITLCAKLAKCNLVLKGNTPLHVC